MTSVVLLRGVNVGGHRTFRPTAFASQLAHLGIVNIGAAGTFVVRRSIPQADLRREIASRLPFEAEVILCPGSEILRLVRTDPFAGQPVRKDIVRFVSVLARAPRAAPTLPLTFPATGQWLLTVLHRDKRFALGMYRRQMKAIGHLGALDRVFGVPVTTRNWNTIAEIVSVLERRE